MPWDHSIEIDQDVTIKGGVTIKGDVLLQDIYNLPVLSIDPNEQVIDINGDIQSAGSINTCGDISAHCLSACSLSTSADISAGGTINAHTLSVDHIILSGETLVSWADLHPILRFTSPELPANCSQFYFEGCVIVTGTKFQLPFIQVRETATGKLVQTPEMDVWVNLDETCTAYTLGKPIANIEPCTSAIEAGKWTAIVMN